LYRQEDEGYIRTQQVLHEELKDLCSEVRLLLASHDLDLADERLAVALLTHFPPEAAGGAERVIVLASSDRIMTSVDSIAPIPLRDASDWTGVKAICRGGPVDEAKDVYASRWRYVLAFPVYTDGVRTPLGAITIASMSPSSRLALRRLPPQTRMALTEVVGERSRRLFTLAGGDG
jgi:hypothetical protein